MLLRLARLLQLGDFPVIDVPKPQALLGGLVKLLAAVQNRLVPFLHGFIPHVEHVHELVLCRQQVRAVNGENWRILLDQLATRENKELLHVAFDAGDVIPMLLFVISDEADRANGLRERPLLNRGVSHANLLLARHGNGKGRESVGSVGSVGAWTVLSVGRRFNAWTL